VVLLPAGLQRSGPRRRGPAGTAARRRRRAGRRAAFGGGPWTGGSTAAAAADSAAAATAAAVGVREKGGRVLMRLIAAQMLQCDVYACCGDRSTNTLQCNVPIVAIALCTHRSVVSVPMSVSPQRFSAWRGSILPQAALSIYPCTSLPSYSLLVSLNV
jgi:hypothetical protein